MAPPGGHSEIAKPNPIGDKGAVAPTRLGQEGISALSNPEVNQTLIDGRNANNQTAIDVLNKHFGDSPQIIGADMTNKAQTKQSEQKSAVKSASDKLPESKAGNSHAITEIGKGSSQPEKTQVVANGGESARAKSGKESLTSDGNTTKPTKAESKPEPKRESKPESKSETKLESKSESKPESKRESKRESKPEPKLESKSESKPEPKREAKPEPKSESKLESKSESKPESKRESKPESKPESKSESKPEPKREAKPESKSESKRESKSESKPEPKLESKSESKPESTKVEPTAKSVTPEAQLETKSNSVTTSNDQSVMKEQVATAAEVKTTQVVDGKQINAVVKSEPEQGSVSKNNAVAPAEQSNVVHTADGKNTIVKAEAGTIAGAKESSSSSERQLVKESGLAKSDELDKATKGNTAESDDDRLTIHEQQAMLNHLDHQGNASVVAAADTQSQNANFSPVANQENLGRSSSVAPSVEANISHSVNHIVNAHIVRSAEETRIGGRIEELPVQNNNSSQVAANQTATQTATQTASSGHSNQSTTGQGNHSGTAHGAGKTGHGHDPNASGHTGTAAGHGHNPAGNSHDPSSKGHSGPNDPSANNSGHGHDPAAKDPSAADPSGKPGSVASTNDPTGNQTGHNANDPAANQIGHNANDPQGNTANNSTVIAGTSTEPVKGQANTTGDAKEPGSVNPVHPGIDPNNHCNAQGGGSEILMPVFVDRPMRNLITLISEMGTAIGPLQGIWSPWGEIGSINNHVVPAISHSTNIFDAVTNNAIATPAVVSVQSNNLSVDNASIISQHPQDIISSQVSSELISNNSGNVIPSADQIPLVQVSTDGAYIPTGNSASVDTSSVNSGASEATVGNGAAVGPGFSTDAAVNNANSPAVNQALQGVVDYWTADPNVSNNMPGPNHVQSTPNDLDPVPGDNSVSYGTAHDVLPDHEQLVSAAQHYHDHGQVENFENSQTVKHDARTEMSNAWSGDPVNGHDGTQVGDAWQQQELQNRVDYLINGLWQEPNTKNASPTNSSSGNKDIKNKGSKAAKNDGLIGQLITLLNDTKGKKAKTLRKTYIVKRGDTLESIAVAIFMDSRLGVLLYSVNEAQLRNTAGLAWQQAKLVEGMVLYLPEDDEVNRFKLALLGRGAKGKVSIEPANDIASAIGPFEQQLSQGAVQRRQNVERLLGPLNSVTESKYDPQTGRASIVVRLGDTIRSIALKHPSLNDVSLWKLLASCNSFSTEVDAKGTPLAILTRGMVLQIPSESEIFKYRNTQAAQIRAHSPRKAISAEVLKVS